MESGSRGGKASRGTGRGVDPRYIFFSLSRSILVLWPRRGATFLPRKKIQNRGIELPPRDPRFDSRCDLCRSSLRDNNYLKAVRTLPTLRRGDRSDAGPNICRETRLVILKPKIAVSSRRRERERERRVHGEEKQSPYI